VVSHLSVEQRITPPLTCPGNQCLFFHYISLWCRDWGVGQDLPFYF